MLKKTSKSGEYRVFVHLWVRQRRAGCIGYSPGTTCDQLYCGKHASCADTFQGRFLSTNPALIPTTNFFSGSLRCKLCLRRGLHRPWPGHADNCRQVIWIDLAWKGQDALPRKECHAPAEFAPHVLLGENAAQAADIHALVSECSKQSNSEDYTTPLDLPRPSRSLHSTPTRWRWSSATLARTAWSSE